MNDKKLCECGCGLRVSKGSRFRQGHHARVDHPLQGKKHSKESRVKMSRAQGGSGVLKEELPSQFCACGCGQVTSPGCKYIQSHYWTGKKLSVEHKKKVSNSVRKNNPMHNPEIRNKHAEAMRKKEYREGCRQRALVSNPMKCPEVKAKFSTFEFKRKMTETMSHSDIRKKISIAKQGQVPWNKGLAGTLDYPLRGRPRNLTGQQKQELSRRFSGASNPNWKGGISAEPYCDIWLDEEYKNSIKERDGNKCMNSISCRGNCFHLPLTIHHIDHNKKNCYPQNLITLCNSCNARANYNREYWRQFYQKIMNEIYSFEYQDLFSNETKYTAEVI